MATQEEREAFWAEAKKATHEALSALLDVLRDPGNCEHARVAAAKEILNRGWGVPPAAPDVRIVTSDDSR